MKNRFLLSCLLVCFEITVSFSQCPPGTGVPWCSFGNNISGGEHVGGDATSTWPLDLKTLTDYAIRFYTNTGLPVTNPRMVILGGNSTTGGYVGIGVTTPVERIDISGNIHLPQSGTINLNAGNQRFISNPIPANILIGIGAGNSITGGTSCTYIGENAGATSTANGGNTYIGWQSGAAATGFENTFLGSRSGESNSSNNNVYNGMSAGQLSSTGNSCVVIGASAGYRNRADYSTFLGESAGFSNTTGAQNTCTGYSSGYYCLTGGYNTFNGFKTGINNLASGNTFMGNEAGLTNTTGGNLVFLGYKAGYSNTGGANNTFVGFESGAGNTGASGNTFTGYRSGRISTAANNTFIGTESGAGNTSATGQTFVGYHSGFVTTTGANNTFFGYESGLANTTGEDNIFGGNGAGKSNIAGKHNTFIGRLAGASSVGKDNCTYVGFQSGTDATGEDNTMVGSNSGVATTTGEKNTFIGKGSGLVNTTGKSNSYFGWNSGPSTTTTPQLDNSAAIGANAEVLNSNQMILGDNNVSVGIGLSGDATGPTAKLDVRDQRALPGSMVIGINAIVNGANTENRGGTFIANSATTNKGVVATCVGAAASNIAGEFFAVAGTNNIGVDAFGHFGTTGIGGRFTSTGSTITSTGVCGLANSPLANANYGGMFTAGNTSVNNYGLWATASGASVINYAVYASASGTCISTTSCAAAAGYFNGNLAYTGSLVPPSDASLKINVTPIAGANAIIEMLNPKTYQFDNVQYDYMHLPEGNQFGLIAQELELTHPQFVKNMILPALYDDQGNMVHPEKAYKGVDYIPLITLLLAGHQEQQQQINDLQTQITNCCGAPKMGNTNSPGSNNTLDIELTNTASSAILSHPLPNPFATATTIRYYIPENVIHAKITFRDEMGSTLKEVEINETGEGIINVDSSELINGTYTYSLSIENRVIETKRMIKVR